MGQTLLVDIDIALGSEMLKAMDDAGLKISVAMWLNSSEYDDWRFLVSSRILDVENPLGAHRLVETALRAGGIAFGRRPPVMIREMNSPFIREIRKTFRKKSDVNGMRLGNQYIGDRFVHDAYVYRIS